MRRVGEIAVLLVLSVGLGHGQTVSIDADHATLAEIAAMIQAQAGVSVAVRTVPPDYMPSDMKLRIEDWPVDVAVGHLARKASGGVRQVGGGFEIVAYESMRRPTARVGDYEFELVSLSWWPRRGEGAEGPRASAPQALEVYIMCDNDADDEKATIYGFDSAIRMVTDTGATLEPLQDQEGGPLQSVYQIVGARLLFPMPPPDARALASIEGDLILFRDVERVGLDFGLDEVGVEKVSGDARVTFESFERQKCEATFAIQAPPDPVLPLREMVNYGTPTLIGQLGERRLGTSHSGTGPRDSSVWHETWQFGHLGTFAPTAIRYVRYVSRDPTQRLHYRFENVPLPTRPGADAE